MPDDTAPVDILSAPKGDDAFAALAATVDDGKARNGEGQEKGERKASPRQASSTRTPPLEKRLSQTFSTIAVIVSAFDPTCGSSIQDRADDLAGAWNRLAQQNPRVKAAIESLLEGGAYGEALFVTAVTVIPILKHHGLLPGNLSVFVNGTFEDDANPDFGETPPPDIAESGRQ
jgi:hypothetical protein